MLVNKAKNMSRQLAGRLLGAMKISDARPPVFVAGCQRSGTTMLLDVLREADGFRVFPEGDPSAFGREMRILSSDVLRYLMYRNAETRIVLKPLNDIQHLDELLSLHPKAQAIWIYRDYRDVASSLVEKWGDVQKAHVREIAAGHYSGPGSAALGEKISDANIALVKSLADRELSAHEAAALIWALRNSVYFDLGLDEHRNVILVRYEDLCTEPDRSFPPLFDFLDCRHSSECWRTVHADSVSRHAVPDIDEQTSGLCEELLNRLDAASGRLRSDALSHVDASVVANTPELLSAYRSPAGGELATTDNRLSEKKRKVS